MNDNESRRFLLLQGPIGPFFYRLAQSLRAEGHEARRIQFNTGDRVFSLFRNADAVLYDKPAQEWEGWFTEYIADFKPTDIILYGDCRPWHKTAINIARLAGIRVRVLEEGYIRPNMVTLEENGVNAHSAMLMDPEHAIEQARRYTEDMEPVSSVQVGPTMRHQVWLTAVYYTRIMLSDWVKKQHSHRELSAWAEGWLWSWRGVVNLMTRRKTRRVIEDVAQSDTPFFVFTQQLTEDSQIREHSSFGSTWNSITAVMDSFAAHAPKNAMLVIKNHPMDIGIIRYEKHIRHYAEVVGLSGRVVYIDGGSMVPLMEKALGVVTVNSTSGLQAIHHGVPTKTLDPTIYNHEGLVDQQPLETFWQNPQKPDMALYRSFRKYLLDTCQVNGSFYSPRGMEILLPNLVKALTATPELRAEHPERESWDAAVEQPAPAVAAE